jgi:hypothetical protein
MIYRNEEINCYYYSILSQTIRLYRCRYESEENCESCEEEGSIISAVLVRYDDEEHYYCAGIGLPINELVVQRDKGMEI